MLPSTCGPAAVSMPRSFGPETSASIRYLPQPGSSDAGHPPHSQMQRGLEQPHPGGSPLQPASHKQHEVCFLHTFKKEHLK